jgi:16S rRNA (guanine1516-N2)-methyltransferase
MKIPAILPKIGVSASTECVIVAAQKLADELKLPFIIHDTSAYDYVLLMTPAYLCLKKTCVKQAPLVIDFLSAQISYRQKRISFKNELVAKALGVKKSAAPIIIDATGGLARDSFIMASLGFEVQMIERNPIIHALLADGLIRGRLKNAALERIHLIKANAIDWLPTLESPDIIYLDPMFPTRKKSALPKQEMLIFHDIVGGDPDSEQLFQTALTCARMRVVVKRPRLADYLAGKVPSFSHTGSSCRFDVYLT